MTNNRNEIVRYDANGTEVELSRDTIKQYLCHGATDQEAELFLRLCQAQRINPFLREAYLVKYGDKAQMIVGKDFFVKRAKENPTFRGFRAGIIVQLQGNKGIERRPGTFYKDGAGEKLLGAFCDVYIKGWEFPLEHTVSYGEFKRATSTWKDMPATMLRKVALVQALREAFPEDFRGLYSEEEMPVDDSNLDREPVVIDDAEIVDDAATEEKDHAEVIDEADTISDAQRKRMFAIAGDEGLVRAAVARAGYEHTSDITTDDYDAIIADIEQAKEALDGKAL